MVHILTDNMDFEAAYLAGDVPHRGQLPALESTTTDRYSPVSVLPALDISLDYSYSATNTNSAQQNTVNKTFTLNAGDKLEVGTCNLPGSSVSGDTHLRLYGVSGTEVAYNDDNCGGLIAGRRGFREEGPAQLRGGTTPIRTRNRAFRSSSRCRSCKCRAESRTTSTLEDGLTGEGMGDGGLMLRRRSGTGCAAFRSTGALRALPINACRTGSGGTRSSIARP